MQVEEERARKAKETLHAEAREAERDGWMTQPFEEVLRLNELGRTLTTQTLTTQP